MLRVPLILLLLAGPATAIMICFYDRNLREAKVPDDVHDVAEAANSLAQQATANAMATGVMLDALIDTLATNGTLDGDETEALFRSAYDYVNGPLAKDVRGTPLHALVLEIIRRTAEAKGVRLEGSA